MQNKWQEILALVGVLGFLFGQVSSGHRKLDFTFNEDCHDLCTNTTARLGHVIAAGPNDTLHYVWDFTRNPSILIVVTSPSAKLQINWSKFLKQTPNSISFTEKPIYSFGVAIERLLEFDDGIDHARIDEVGNRNISELKFEDFQWHHKNLSKYGDLVEFSTEACGYRDPETNATRKGCIQFLMHGFGSSDHSEIMPCLMHSENATQVDMVLDHLETKKKFSTSRFAIELIVVSENDSNNTLAIDTKRKLDDEFTPGIFEVIELTTPQILDKTAYMKWKPVSYIGSDRDVTNSTGATTYSAKTVTVDDYHSKSNLLYLYYGDNMHNYLAQRLNVSLGSSKDGFYKKSEYNTWTFIAGYGSPTEERFSYAVLLIIFACVSTPMLIFAVLGVHMMCFRRMPESSELLINR